MIQSGLKSIVDLNLQPTLRTVITVALHEYEIENAWEYDETK
jgi:hypothetical protein